MRKVKELLITRRLEAALTKQRIFEIYLNMIEWGDGIFGCEAAARAYFGKSCASLDIQEAALMAGAIINPREHSPAQADAAVAAAPADHPATDAVQAAARPPPAPAPSNESAPIENADRFRCRRRSRCRRSADRRRIPVRLRPGTSSSARRSFSSRAWRR